MSDIVKGIQNRQAHRLTVNEIKKTDVKMAMAGESGVGKTSLVSRYIFDEFSDQERSTLGASYFEKVWGEKKAAIWDTAGQQIFDFMLERYFAEAKAVFLVYDVTNYDSFKALSERYLPQLEKECLRMVIGARSDLVGETIDNVSYARQVNAEEAVCFAKQINPGFLSMDRQHAIPFFETSSKTGLNVKTAFEFALINTLGPIRLQNLPSIRIINRNNNTKPENSEEKARCRCTIL